MQNIQPMHLMEVTEPEMDIDEGGGDDNEESEPTSGEFSRFQGVGLV